jgi:hypothetical protein
MGGPPTVTTGLKERHTSVVHQPAFLEAKEALLEQAETFAGCMWPMLCEPNDWTDWYEGGSSGTEKLQDN